MVTERCQPSWWRDPRFLALALAAAVVAAPALVGAAETKTLRHSGTILAVDPGGKTMVLGEVGPWRQENGRTVVTRRTIRVTSATTFTEVARAAQAPSGFPRDFVEAPLDASTLATGDFVTLECRHDGNRLTAVKVTRVKPEGS